jgi:hypothetical protein
LAKLLQPLAVYAGSYFSVGTHLRPTKVLLAHLS